MVSKRCEHGKNKNICKECKGCQICEHNHIKSTCRECKGGSICEHNKIRSKCVECGGNEVCKHGKNKHFCKECKGSQICEHGRQKHYCKVCIGSSVCSHMRIRWTCSICEDNKLKCQHGKNKNICKECKGCQICEHNNIKSTCRECKGGSICEHNKIRSKCVECGGNEVCKHGKNKHFCKECKGSQICEHKKQKSSCAECDGRLICKARREPYNTGCRTLGNRKLGGFCCFCFVNLFPEDPRALTVRKKSKELQVMTHVYSKYKDFKNDKPFYVDLEGGCCATKRRIDLRKLINNTMLCIEVDEHQHKKYVRQDENNRYDDLFMDFSGKYIFIRYNPDKFVDKYNKSKNPMFGTRMEVLENSINKHIKRIHNYENTDLVEIHHLFYDENT